MTIRFADTFYYLALLNPDDAWHPRAVAFSESLLGPTVTTAWVLTEVADAMSAPRHRDDFLRLLDALDADHECTIIPATAELFRRDVQLYRERPDKDWPLTDCISFVVMRQHGMTEALTADHHFEQAGFKILLR